jgi:predicted SAM-dependent methyltransferase
MKLHLGCGPRYIPGWIHVDVVDLPHIHLRHSIDSLPAMLDGSVDTIYACHVLEHFVRMGEVERVLTEWKRVLKPLGVLRIAVPDFEALCQHYINTHRLGDIIGPLFGGQRGSVYNFHYTVFDFETLSAILTRAGFADIARYDWRGTEHATVDDYSQAYLPHMDKENGLLISLNVEARKPNV